ILHPYFVAAAGGGKYVPARNHRRPLVVGEEVTPAELLIATVVIGLNEELVFGFTTGRAYIIKAPAGCVRDGDLFEEKLRDRANAIQRNLVARERLLSDRVDQLLAGPRKIAGAFG